MKQYFRIAVNVRLTHRAPVGKAPINQVCKIACAPVFACNALPASAGTGFHVKLPAQNLGFTGVFFMMDSLVVQELRDQYNDLTQRVAELRRFL